MKKAGSVGISTQEYGTKKINLILRGMPGSPLVVHAFDDKVKQQIRDKQQKKERKAKTARNPKDEFLAARYIDNEGRECVPIMTVKKSLISAATAFQDLTKVALRQSLFVTSTASPSSYLVPIETHDGKQAVGQMREDAVTIGMGTRDLTYRPEYKEWQICVTIEYLPSLISEEQLLPLAKHAGWGCGICEGRPERTSALGWGRYEPIKV